MYAFTVLAKICDANAVMLIKLHVDSVTMATNRGRMGGVGGGGVSHRRLRSLLVIRDKAPESLNWKTQTNNGPMLVL